MAFLIWLRRHYFIGSLILIGLFTSILFILLGLNKNALGFPLDDAWIHQTYAKNLVALRSWSYTGAKISGGSTSPLWTLLISTGYLVSNKWGIVWTFLLSISSFICLVVFAILALQKLSGMERNWKLLIPGVVIATEWHLLWGTASGMETILYSLGVVLLFFVMLHDNINWLVVGILEGLLIWVRPDGLTLLGPIILIFIFELQKKKGNWKNLSAFLFPFILLLCAYFGFNYLTNGQFFPSTFYAKQVEYQQLLTAPLSSRILNEFSPIMTGAGVILLPGFLIEIWDSFRKKKYKAIGFILWVLGFVILYADRLPVIYQHGRYIFPVIAIYFILALAGVIKAIDAIHQSKTRNLLSMGWIGAILILSVSFYSIGIKTYREDLQAVNELMVQPAQWVAENIPSNQIIAVHDIGAVGYFTQNPLIDLAGLVNSDVIPFMHDEKDLLNYMKTSGASYFLGFSDWYSTSSSWGQMVKTFSVKYQAKQQEVIIIKLNAK